MSSSASDKLHHDMMRAFYNPTSHWQATSWDERVFDMMNYLVKKHGPCKVSYASRNKGIVAVFKGKYRVSISDEGKTEWLTEEPSDARFHWVKANIRNILNHY